MANQPNKMKTTFSFRGSSDPIMTGKENFEILGNAIQPEIVKTIVSHFAGLNLFYDCNRKVSIASHFLANLGIEFEINFGELFVDSKEKSTNFGYKFNPPYEFHCWIGLPGENILDVSLPGTILKGKLTSDNVGPFLIGRKEFILNGRPKNWLHYTTHETTLCQQPSLKRPGM